MKTYPSQKAIEKWLNRKVITASIPFDELAKKIAKTIYDKHKAKV